MKIRKTLALSGIALILASAVFFLAAIWATGKTLEDNYLGTGGVVLGLAVVAIICAAGANDL